MLVPESEIKLQRKASLIIGITMFIMAICSGFAFGAIHNKLIISGNATATMNNILESISLLRAEIFCWLIILLCDITVSWALYIFIPKFLGILLLLASFSYIIIHSFHLFIPQCENTTILFEKILSLPMAVGELGFGLWLLIKGGKVTNITS